MKSRKMHLMKTKLIHVFVPRAEQKHSAALLGQPWLVKTTSNDEQWLIKYGPHPDRAGYIFIATNLERVLYESLTAPSIPPRLSEIAQAAKKPKSQKSESQVDVDDIVAQSQRTLKDLENVMAKKWNETEVEIKKHHFYDSVFMITNANLTWAFNTTELDARQSILILAQHLIGPLARGLASSHKISPNSQDTPLQYAVSVLENKKIVKELQIGVVPDDEEGEEEENNPKGDESEVDDGQDNAESLEPPPSSQKSPRAESEASSSSPPPAKTRRASDSQGKGKGKKRVIRVINDDETDESMKSPTPPGKDESPEGDEAEGRDSRDGPSTKSPSEDQEEEPRKPRKAVSQKPPSQKVSQKTKREREREEEDEFERRREEMKRKMESGGGGRLGKRRLRR